MNHVVWGLPHKWTLRACSASILGVLPRPSIRAEPASVIPRGQTVTIVCQGPAGMDTFRLEKEGEVLYPDVKSLHETETQASFPIPASEDTAGLYRCLYYNGANWSERSEPLQLVVTGEDVSACAHRFLWDDVMAGHGRRKDAQGTEGPG